MLPRLLIAKRHTFYYHELPPPSAANIYGQGRLRLPVKGKSGDVDIAKMYVDLNLFDEVKMPA